MAVVIIAFVGIGSSFAGPQGSGYEGTGGEWAPWGKMSHFGEDDDYC